MLGNKRNPYLSLNMSLSKWSHRKILTKMYYKFNDIIEDQEVLGKEYTLGVKNRKNLNTLS